MSAEEVYGVLSHEKRQVAKQPGGKQASDPPSGGKTGLADRFARLAAAATLRRQGGRPGSVVR
jgi:hypothetical protein